jgi:energy-coupling factor transporter ATP-binding protein EcfA2
MMLRLKTLRYSEEPTPGKRWSLEGLELGSINLLVGRNATGKSRVLNIISNFAKQLMPDAGFRVHFGLHELIFDDNGKEYKYVVSLHEGKVIREEVIADGTVMLYRGEQGQGEIFIQEIGARMRFRPPENELAVVARRDSLQHPFLEPLNEWALAVRHYTFGATLGKDRIVVHVPGGPEVDDRDNNQVVGIFKKGEQKYPQQFVQAVIDDMAELNYHLDGIVVKPPDNVKVVPGGFVPELSVLAIKEKGVSGIIDQAEMSQGMFRAMSILIQVNYSQMTNRANCILIDDIGEGLDFERSTGLIEILRRKAKTSSFQLVMSTNDQYVMNHVPLEEWSVLQRDGSTVRVRNHQNSKEAFDDFKFVGMSNFSFFEMDFVNGPPMEAATSHE